MTNQKTNKITIISITVSPRSSQRAIIKFSDDSFLLLSLDSIVKSSLTKGQSLSPSRYQKIVASSLLFLLKEYALRQIAISPKTSKILTLKLRFSLPKIIRKYHIAPAPPSQPLIQKTLSYIQDKGLFDQQNYVDYFLRRHPHLPARRLKILLLHQGIDPQFLPPTLLADSGEKQKIKTILNKKVKHPKNLSDYQTKRKIMLSLARKGFAYSDIKMAIDEFVNLS